jgi:hypothetical protein
MTNSHGQKMRESHQPEKSPSCHFYVILNVSQKVRATLKRIECLLFVMLFNSSFLALSLSQSFFPASFFSIPHSHDLSKLSFSHFSAARFFSPFLSGAAPRGITLSQSRFHHFLSAAIDFEAVSYDSQSYIKEFTVPEDRNLTLTKCSFYFFTRPEKNGGALSLRDIALTAISCTFRRNKALSGAAVYISSANTAPFSDCHFAQNTAVTAALTALSVQSLTIAESIFYLNKADTTASSLKIRGCEGVYITSTQFLKNRVGNGTTVSFSKSAGTVSGLLFAINTANRATAVSFKESKFVVGNSRFIDGGSASIFLSSACSVTLSDCKFAGAIDAEIVNTNGDLKTSGCIENIPILLPELPVLEPLPELPKKDVLKPVEPEGDEELRNVPQEERPEGSLVAVVILIIGIIVLIGYFAFGRGNRRGPPTKDISLFAETRFDPTEDFENGIGPEDFHFDMVPDNDS